MYRLAVASAALVAAVAAAANNHNGKNCRDITVPVHVEAELKQFNYKPTDEEIDTTNFFLGFTRHNSTFMKELMTGVRSPSPPLSPSTPHPPPPHLLLLLSWCN